MLQVRMKNREYETSSVSKRNLFLADTIGVPFVFDQDSLYTRLLRGRQRNPVLVFFKVKKGYSH